MRLIDADALYNDMIGLTIVAPNVAQYATAVINFIGNAPAVDAEVVCRCKECEKRGDPGECPMCFFIEGDWADYTNDNGYCDRGERRGDP